MGLVFIPMYIKYLGMEAYGLIGVFALLQAWLSLLDMGMTPTLGREMARFTAGSHNAREIRDLLRSIEIVALGVALVVATGTGATSSWLANDWMRAETLPREVVAHAFSIMGIVTAMRFVEGIYRSSIVGLERQVLFNVVNSTMATIRSVGAIAVLAKVSPTIGAFFVWQGAVSLATVVVLALATYSALPRVDGGGRFSLEALRGVGRFAGGMVGITLLSLSLTQVDKILLSRLLTLSEYGYYTLAAVVAGALSTLLAPITQAWFPRLSALRASNDTAGLIRAYHQGAQLVSVVVGSAGITLIVFAEPILLLWTKDAELARRTATLVRLLALGNLLNGLMWIPYQTQLAYGWTGLSVGMNVVSVLIVVPAIVVITPRYGGVGAACVWVTLNTGYVLIGIQFMFRKILTAEKWYWYRQDVLQPLLSALAVASLSRWAVPLGTTVAVRAATLALTSALTLAAAAFAAPLVRRQLASWGSGVG
jgi:O-antigen/teichoic acid export membrane protein